MLKLLHVHSGNMYGGVERVLATLASIPPEQSGLEHEFALCYDGAFRKEVEPLANVHAIDRVNVRRPWSIRRGRDLLESLLSKTEFDAVIVHSAWAQAIFGATVRAMGAAQVYWVHDALDGRHWLQRWARLSTPDHLLCSSRFVATTIPKLYPHRESSLLYYPVRYEPETDSRARESVRQEMMAAPDEVVIVQVGRMEPYKGHRQLIEALGRLRDVPGWRLWQVGGAQRPSEVRYVRNLARLASNLSIADRVTFAGHRSDVSRVLAGADIFCQPNLGPEPFGLTFVEAMHAGLPVVTTAFGGAIEAVGECGWLVDPADIDGLAVTLRKLIDEPGLRSRSAVVGREHATNLTDPFTQSRRLASILNDLLLVSRRQ